MSGRSSPAPSFRKRSSWQLPAVLGGGACDVCPCLLHPSGHLWVANGVEEPAKQREAVSAPQPEAGRVRSKRVRERPRIVVDGADGVGDDLRHRFWVFFVIKEVS